MDFLEERYSLAFEKIGEIAEGKDGNERLPKEMTEAFAHIAGRWIVACELYERCKEQDEAFSAALCKSREFKESYLDAVLPENYQKNIEDPARAVKMLKRKNGQLFSAMANEAFLALNYALNGDLELLTVNLELFIEVFCIFKDAFSDTDSISEASDHAFMSAKESIASFMKDNLSLYTEKKDAAGICFIDVNPQFVYDHLRDSALWLDSVYFARYVENGKRSEELESRIFEDALPKIEGSVPVAKRENISFTPAQKRLMKKYRP